MELPRVQARRRSCCRPQQGGLTVKVEGLTVTSRAFLARGSEGRRGLQNELAQGSLFPKAWPGPFDR